MAEEVSTPAAESSPAPEAKPAPPAEPVSVPTDPEAYAEWRQTGKLPENGRKPAKRETSATSKTSVDSDDESESATVSETASTTGKRSAEKRIDKVIAEREALRRELEALKATGKQDAKQPESSSVPQPAEIANKRPVKPKQEDYKTWDEYEAADDKYHEALADWKADQKLEEHLQKQRQQASVDAFQVRLNEAKARYGEEAESKVLDTAKAIYDNQKVPLAIRTAIGRSEVVVDALYVMGSDADELSSFVALAETDPLEALRKWFTVEALVKQELAGKSKSESEKQETPPRAADGKFQPVRPKAPAPPTELNGNSGPLGDERDRAANTGNVRAFFEAGNRRDMQRWKGNG